MDEEIKYFKLRVSHLGNTYEQVRDIVKKYSPDCWFGCYEISKQDVPHSHWYLELKVSPENVRRSIRDLKSEKDKTGNRIYSLRELDDEKPATYIAYIMKDGQIEHHGFTEEKIAECLAEDKRIKEEMAALKVKKRPILLEISERLEAKLQDNEYPAMISGELRYVPLTPYHLTDEVIAYFLDTGKLVREFMMISVVQTLCLKYIPRYRYTLKSRIMEKIEEPRK